MVGRVNVPEDLRYTTDHEWARQEGGRLRVGITDYAQDALGDVVYVQLPAPGSEAKAGEPLGELESTKSVSDVYAPVDGTVVEVNSELVDSPQHVNEDPYGEGWICVIEPSLPEAFLSMMTPEDYRKHIEA
jgi:glycine cleavage system H protein